MAEENKQKSLIEFIESVNADCENSTTVIAEPTSETEEHTEIDLELSLGGCYSENKGGGRNEPRSNPNPSDIVKDARLEARNDAFLRVIGVMNWEVYRWTLIQSIAAGDGSSSLSPTYPDTSLTMGIVPHPNPIQETNHIPMSSSSNPSLGRALEMTQLQSYLPHFVKGTPGFFPPLPSKNRADGVSTSGVRKDLMDPLEAEPASKRARTEDQEGERSNVVPRVFIDGGNPNGVIIYGFLGKYTKDQVFICCACHHRVLTPAEFVKHAGGSDVENPLQLIKMVNQAEEESDETGN